LAADRDQKVDEKPTSHSRFLKNPGLKITLPEDGSVDFL